MARGTIKDILSIDPGGVREDLNAAAIPDGNLLSSSNWLTRRGIGRPRPGYQQVDSALAAADRIIGIGFRGSAEDGTNVVLHTLSAAVHWDGTSQTVITGTWSASAVDQLVRMETFVTGGTTWLARVNEANAVDKWDGTGSAFQNIAAAPSGRDLLSIGNRLIVAGTDDFTVQWSDFNDLDTWSAANTAVLLETQGRIVGGKALTPLSFAVYKDDSVILGTVQASRIAFQFQFIGHVPGPLSPACIVRTGGVHYWLAEDYAIYSFDGSRIRVVTSALGTTLFDTIRFADRGGAHGALLQLESPETWFFYPDQASGGVRRAASVNIANGAVNSHIFTRDITASSNWQKQQSLSYDDLPDFSATIDGLSTPFSTINSMTGTAGASAIIGDINGNFYQFGRPADDEGTAIPWEFIHGFKVPAGIGKRLYLDGIVSYWTQTSPSLTVTVGVTPSDALSDAETETTSTFDTNTASNHLLTTPNTIGQWYKIRHAASSAVEGLEHRGAAIIGWPRSMV